MRPHVCQQCGRTYMAKPTKDGRRFCSKRCYGDAKMLPTLEPRTCGQCGKTFVPNRHSFTTAAYQGAFCSIACANKARSEPLMERYAKYLALAERTDNGCLLWPGTRDKKGYGVITDDARRQLSVTRLTYELQVGPLAKGLYVCHRCDNPPCFEPSHLFAGTPQDNMTDRNTKGRQSQGERFSHAKLKDADIPVIRARYAPGGVSQEAIAADYGVSQVVISGVVRRKLWKHIP